MNTAFKKILPILFLGGIAVFFLFSFGFIAPSTAFAQVMISASFPGAPAPAGGNPSPGEVIGGFYQYALMVGGILALGVVVYGGIKYMTSVGNPSNQSDAKEWIQAAILGVLLLGGAYFILRVINPDLVNLSLSGLGSVGPTTSVGGGGTAGGTLNCQQCQKLPNCTVVAGVTNCGGAPAMAKELSCINAKDSKYIVNEGFPPIGSHSDQGHDTGCAVDLHIPDQCGAGGCSKSQCSEIAALESAAEQCGTPKPLDEYSGCSDSKQYVHTTGGNLHIDAPKGSGGC